MDRWPEKHYNKLDCNSVRENCLEESFNRQWIWKRAVWEWRWYTLDGSEKHDNSVRQALTSILTDTLTDRKITLCTIFGLIDSFWATFMQQNYWLPINSIQLLSKLWRSYIKTYSTVINSCNLCTTFCSKCWIYFSDY